MGGTLEAKESLALILQGRRDARITAARLEDARKKLDLLHAGSRAEDIAEAVARRDAAKALFEEGQAQRDERAVKAPGEGTVKVLVKVLATLGRFVSTAVPKTLVEIDPPGGR